jgi:hypothetical protein
MVRKLGGAIMDLKIVPKHPATAILIRALAPETGIIAVLLNCYTGRVSWLSIAD